MNLPKQLFYLTVPPHLHINDMPDLLVKVETTIQNNKVTLVEFIAPATMDLIKVTNWNELYEIACDRAQALHDQNSVTALGTITDPSNVMPGILHDMNSVNQSSKVLNN